MEQEGKLEEHLQASTEELIEFQGERVGPDGSEAVASPEDEKMIRADGDDDDGGDGEEEGAETDDSGEEDEDDVEDDEYDEEDDDAEEGDEQDEDEEMEEDLGDEDEDIEEDEEEWENVDGMEKCPVCLDVFWDKEVGSPESCDHIFCLDCILEWSRNINTCPVDRSLFRSILVRHSLHGEVVRRIEVDEKKPEEQDEDDATYCEVCGRCDREDRLLLCDGCDAGYHCECLDPPLVHIPIEEWYCPECVAQNRHQEDDGSEEEPEVTELRTLQTTQHVGERSTTLRRRHVTPARAIARTHVSERVRARITRARAAEREVEQRLSGTSSTARRKPVKHKTTKKRKAVKKQTTKKRKVSSKTTTSSGKIKRKRKIKKKKKRSKIKKRVTKAAVPKTIRGRIADRLMLVKPRTGSMMPEVKVKGQQTLGIRRSEIGAATLMITGSDNLLDISETASTGTSEAATSSVRTPQFVSSSSTSDLLGSIISGQDMLHMSSKDVTINRDGSLTKIGHDKESKSRKHSPYQDKGQNPGDKTSPKQSSTSPDDHKRKESRDQVLQSAKDGEKRTRFQAELEEDRERNVTLEKAKEDSEIWREVTGTGQGRTHEEKYLEGRGKNRMAERRHSKKNLDSEMKSDEDSGDEDSGEVEEVEEEMEDQDEMYGGCFLLGQADVEKVPRKHDGSITCRVSSSSFEESPSEEEGALHGIKSSKRSSGKEGVIKDPQKSKHQDRKSLKARGDEARKGSGRSRRKSSLEEGLIDEDEEGMQPKRRYSLSEEEGLIEDEQDFKMRVEKQRQTSLSDEEGLIADDEDGSKSKLSKEMRKQESSRGRAGHSSAEEGEVKTDEEDGPSSSRKKRKHERRRERNRKDTRTVVIDSEMSLTIPKRPLVEIQREKMKANPRSSDPPLLRDREFDRPGERGVFSDLRHVIQVKRDVPFKRPSRYEAYWTELERRRAMEAQLAEKSVAWERHGDYERPYLYEEDWNRMMLERKPLEHQWENFTIHRERSPTNWRKERDVLEGRVETERRIEMPQQLDLERRFETKRREGSEQKMTSDRRLPEQKMEAKKNPEREKKSDSSRISSKKVEADKERSDQRKVSDSKREERQKSDVESKTTHKGDGNRRHNPNPGSKNARQKSEDGKRESNPKGDAGLSEEDHRPHKKNRERQEKGKHKSITGTKKHKEGSKSDSHSKQAESLKSSGNRDKDSHKDRHRTSKQKSETDSSKGRHEKESLRGGGREHSKEHSHEKDRLEKHDRSSSRGKDRSMAENKHPAQKHKQCSESHSKECSTSQGRSDRSSKHSQDGHVHEWMEAHRNTSDSVNSDRHKRESGKKADHASASHEKEKNLSKDGNKSKETGRLEKTNIQQATSTSDQQIPAQAKSTKRSIRRAWSPSTSHTGETEDEYETSQLSSKQLPITVPATEMVSDKPVLEKVKKKKKDKTKKMKNKSGEKEKDGIKGKKVKKTKGKGKKQKVVEPEITETAKVVTEEVKDDQPPEQELELPTEHPEESEETPPEITESKRPAPSPIRAEPAKKARIEETPQDTPADIQNKTENENDAKDEDSSSDVEMVIGPVKNIYDEIIDLSQISSDEETFPQMATSSKQGKDNTLYDPFEPTASPETISSPDVSEKTVSVRHSRRSRERSPSLERRSKRSPQPRSSPRRRSSPHRQRSVSPRRRSPPRQKGQSKDHGYSSRKQSITPPRKSLQKHRSPSPRRNASVHKRTHSPRRSPSRSRRRSPKRHLSPRKRSLSPREQSSAKRRKAEPQRRHSISPRRNMSPRRRKASPKKSISPRRRQISPRRRSRSPRKRSSSPRRRPPPKRRSVSPRKRSIPLRRRSISPRRRSASPKRRHMSPTRRDPSPRQRNISPRKHIPESSKRQNVSPRRRSVSPHRRDYSASRRISTRKSVSSRSSSSSSLSSRSPSSSSTWSSSSDSWSSSSYSRSRSYSRTPSDSRSPSPRVRRYSRDRSSSSSSHSESSVSSNRSTSLEKTPPRNRSPSPKRPTAVLHQSPTQTSPEYRQRITSAPERTSPVQPRQELPDSTQGSYRLAPPSPTSPDQTLAPATSTTDSHLASKASSQISHILGQLASNPAIQSALNSANLMKSQRDPENSSEGSISGFLKSSETSFTSPPSRPLEIREELDDKGLHTLADVTEDNIESSAVDLYNKNSRERYLKKLQHQERVVEEVKLALKPYYQKREVTKEDYKEILRKSVNQVCHSKSGEINPVKIKRLIEGYIKKFRTKKKPDEKKDTGRPDLAFRLLTKS
ncbi:protein SCAF11-like isoform X2 [Acanthaster planci]|uniref:Protein SCAF11-like isoform X2 n=1 Tax=Acanthaster planci TaxID=133434 RepID=A0A8B7ZLC7_ACAPL|nr:protein SCAF11-like isoform X2 [Acanthaster planci]